MKTKIKESNQNQAATAGQNAPSAATSRKNLAPAPHKEPASGELAAAPCSAVSGASDKQDFDGIVFFLHKEDMEEHAKECRSTPIHLL